MYELFYLYSSFVRFNIMTKNCKIILLSKKSKKVMLFLFNKNVHADPLTFNCLNGK